MSNISPVLNGENTGGVVDFQTDASVNMVAAIHDHISCAKPVPGDPFSSQEKQGEILSYPCDFDHMYASLTERTTGQHDNAEISHLKELLLLHLDLIQQQSEQIVTKDKQLSTLRQENETLRQRLERMDRRVTLHKHREGSDVPVPSSPDEQNTFVPPAVAPSTSSPSVVLTIPPEDVKEDISLIPLNMLFNNNNIDNDSELDSVKLEPVISNVVSDVGNVEATTSTTCYVAKRKRREEDRETSVSSEPRRKRKVSWTSSSAHSDVVSDGRRTPKCTKEVSTLETKRSPKKKTSSNNTKDDSSKDSDVRTTARQYYSAIGERVGWFAKEECDAEELLETDTTVLVPSWRVKTYNSCYTMEGTENLDDEVFNKRHSRLEIDERRRKRWDVQRIREQRQIEKLKQRESSRRSSTANRVREGRESPVEDTLWPDPEEIEFVEVTEHLPVFAFGVPMMDFTPSEFSLPWLTSERTKPPIILPTQNRRRHGVKR